MLKHKRLTESSILSSQMSGPLIPRSQSASEFPASSPFSDAPPSVRSTSSEDSVRTWSKRYGDYIAKKSNSLTKNSKLTAESLKEFNRAIEILEEKRDLNTSPYYKGLTDSSLAIKRLPSPDRYTGSPVSTNTRSSFVSKMKEWSSSFVIRKHKDDETAVDSSSFTGKHSEESPIWNLQIIPVVSGPSTAKNLLAGKTLPNITDSPYYRGLTDSSLTYDSYYVDRKSNSLTKNPKLSEENLESNMGNEILEGKRHNSRSPYYRGLTDSSLVIDKQNPSPPTPERDAGSSYSSNTKPGSVSKMKEWSSSLFIHKHKEDESTEHSSSFQAKQYQEPHVWSLQTLATSSSKKSGDTTFMPGDASTKIPKEECSQKDEVYQTTSTDASSVPNAQVSKGKTLRERISEPSSPPQTPLPSSHKKVSPLARQPQTPERERRQEASALQRSTQTRKRSAKPPNAPCHALDVNEEIQVEETSHLEKDNKYIWAEKYRQFELKDFLCNKSKAIELEALAKTENCGHFIFEGQPGVGKKTMILALLRQVFGPDKVQAREERRKFILKGEAVGSITVKLKQSPKHVELNLSELKGYEKHVIVQLIKEKYNKANKGQKCSHDDCRAIILHDADNLPNEALIYLRWILEKYRGCNKLFFCCSDASKITPLHPLCTLVQLLPPSTEEIIQVLDLIARQEGIKLPTKLAMKIAKNSHNNLRQGIRSFEATWYLNSSLEEDQETVTGWEEDIENTATNIIAKQTPIQLHNIRRKLQNLIEHDVSPEFIFMTLAKELNKNLNEQLQQNFCSLCEIYKRKIDGWNPHANAIDYLKQEKKCQNNPQIWNLQQFMKIEEFIVKFMSWYKSSVIKSKDIQEDES